jgi:hypothetical protein
LYRRAGSVSAGEAGDGGFVSGGTTGGADFSAALPDVGRRTGAGPAAGVIQEARAGTRGDIACFGFAHGT